MNILFNVIAPLFLIVALGWALARYKLVPATVSGPLMQYVFYAAVPEVVFTGIVSNHIEKLFYWPFWVGYPLSLLLGILITAFIFKFILRKSNLFSVVIGFCAATANTVIVGYPVLYGFVGHFAIIPMAVTVFVFPSLFLPMLIFAYELHKR